MSVLERLRLPEEGVADASPAVADEDVRARLRHDLVASLGVDAVAGIVGAQSAERARGELGVAVQSLLNSEGYRGVAPERRGALARRVVDEVVGLGPIQELLEDPSVTEVMVNGCAAIFYERGGTIHPCDARFDSQEQIMVAVDRILAPLGRRLDASSPIVNARLANGDRVNAVAAPVAIDGPVVTIRKFSDAIISLGRLVELGSLPGWYARLLSWAVRLRQGIAVVGGTGSGKTTLLNALSCEIPEAERIVTVEDSAELRFDAHPNVVRLEAREASIEGVGEVSIRALVANALRMRPDRIVVGEVRGAECIDMLQAMNTGHEGSLTTLHAGSADEAVLRLVLMARFGMDLPAEIIEEQIATALDLVVMTRRLASGERVVASLSEVGRSRDGGVELRECVSFDRAGASWHLVAEPAFVGGGVEEGLLDGEEVAAWRRQASSGAEASSSRS